jgi:UDP-3-O-[3-hydroxymyristoyl] glucosamine N-acyltransferase
LNIHPSAVIYPCVKLGKNVKVGANSVLGGEGFGFTRNGYGKYTRIPHNGTVEIGDEVEIGSCTCIDCGQDQAATRIGRGTKIDNLCHIAHNVQIGEDCCLAAGTILAGSVKVGNKVFLGINCAVFQNVVIGKDALIGMGAVVVDDVPAHWVVVGNPARFLRLRNHYVILGGMDFW